MTNMNKLKKYWVVLLVILVMVMVTACKDTLGVFNETQSSDGFKTLTVTNELCSFALQYSGNYKRAGPYGDLKDNSPYMYVKLLAPEKTMQILVPADKDSLKTTTTMYTPATFEIFVYAPRATMDIQNSTERLNMTLEGQKRWENFKLLERLPVTVYGIEGELIAYVVDWFLPVSKGEGPLLQYHKAVYFDYNGLIWTIEATSEMEMVDQVNADFDHIVQTFKIID